MRFSRVTATAFGPLVRQTLEFEPGLNVVVGANESAKSSWHAALYAALCGRKRGKGKPGQREREFEARHRPWAGDVWKASARLVLDDGREVEISQDLDGKVDCRAMEMPTGRDISNELVVDGSVDGSVLVGLNRQAFLATACVTQTDLLRVREDSASLAELLGRVVLSGGGDESTAAALRRIDDFRRDEVGVDKAGAVKPLRSAIERTEAARAAVKAARERRGDFDVLAREVERLRTEQREADSAVRAAHAVLAGREADAAAERAERAQSLSDSLGQRRPSLDPLSTAVAEVSAAITAWASRPSVPEVLVDSEALAAEIELLPDPPAHDTVPHPSVVGCAEDLRVRLGVLADHVGRPEGVMPPPAAGPTAQVLRELAKEYDELGPEPPAPVPFSTAVRSAPPRWPWGLVVLGVVGAGGGLATAQPALTVVGLMLAVAGVVLGGRRPPAPPAATAEPDLRPVWHARRQELDGRCSSIGVNPAISALLIAADLVDVRDERESRHRQWEVERQRLEDALAEAKLSLAQALLGRGYPCDPQSAPAEHERYRRACEEDALQQRAADSRPDLLRQLEQAQGAERRRGEAISAVALAAERVEKAAVLVALPARVGSVPPDAHQLSAALQAWIDEQEQREESRSRAREQWEQFDRLVGDDGLPALLGQAQRLRREADEWAAGLAPSHLANALEITADRLPALEREAADAASRADTEAGRLEQLAAGLPDLASAEESLDSAVDEHHRVEELARVLDRTQEFLEQARDRVHRDIAPALRASLVRGLPRLTGGRYVDAAVDPHSLEVKVCGPSRDWHLAERLSHGTAEQVYLLLRLSLVEHLTGGYDSCPLLLDDVTVHADSVRTEQVLTLLADVARERQVILFSQEEQVRAWAEANLGGRVAAVHRLDDLAGT